MVPTTSLSWTIHSPLTLPAQFSGSRIRKAVFSHDTGGTQFYSLWNMSNGDVFQSLMLSYDIAFDKDFDWVKGGKLPGLRGGPNATGCSGGNQPTGSDCFSVRLMWRQEGAAEGTQCHTRTPSQRSNAFGPSIRVYSYAE